MVGSWILIQKGTDMTIEEAIKLLEIQKPVMGCKEYKKPLMTAYDMAIAVMEKQIPKKPFKPFGTHSYKCSNCWKFVAHEVDDNFDLANLAEWCPYCGQALNWSEVEE